METQTDTRNWPELAIGIWDKLTGREAEIEYEFKDMEILVPSSASKDAAHAKWIVNGMMKIRSTGKVA